jgi:polyisoprenyl-teichoic acid--peptidoglycan teichoic acid transferase
MSWRAPPILDDPHETIVRNGRKLLVYRDGKRIRLVAWKTKKAVYWVSNTLTRSLTNEQMIGIATSLKRLG